MSCAPPSRSVPSFSTSKSSPPSARKLFTVTRYGRTGSIGTPSRVIEPGTTRLPRGADASHV
jgi:hypothetical protein